MLGKSDLLDSAESLLGFIQAAATELGVSLPDRRVLASGGAVYDCPMVAVAPTQVLLGLPESPTGSLSSCGPAAWTMQADLVIVRAAAEAMQGPRGDIPPSPQDLREDAEAMSADVAVLSLAVSKYADLTRTATVSIAIGQPQGGLIAAVASVSVPLWPEILP